MTLSEGNSSSRHHLFSKSLFKGGSSSEFPCANRSRHFCRDTEVESLGPGSQALLHCTALSGTSVNPGHPEHTGGLKRSQGQGCRPAVSVTRASRLHTWAFPAAAPASWMQPSVPWPPEVALTPVESFWSKATVASTIILPSLNSNKLNTFFFKRVCILGVMKNFSVCEALLKLRVKWCFLLSSTGIPWRYTPLVPESWNKASHTDFSDFPVHVKVIFILCCSLLGVQEHYVLKNLWTSHNKGHLAVCDNTDRRKLRVF